MASTAEQVSNAIDLASKATDCAIDIYTKLKKSFKLSDKAKKQSDECEKQMKKLIFKSFDEKYSCKSVKEIPMDEFEAFVNNRLQKRLNLPETTKDSLLDGLYVGENEEKVNLFHFRDGNGDIHHGRFITMKRNGKVDLAYAMYTLSFQLAEKETERESCEWWCYVLPIWHVTHTKEIQNLSENQKDVFSQWCEIKLYNSVAQECSELEG